MAVKIFTCPKCQLSMKSKSGWTLHVKTCCPEQRWRKTTVKMEIEFDIPVALDANEPYFGTRRSRSRVAPTAPMDVFNMAFWAREVKQIGNCQITSAQILDKNIYLREPTAMEKRLMQRASADQNKTQTVAECKRVLREIIGNDHGLSIHTSTEDWPNYVAIMLGNTAGMRKWQVADNAKFTFRFNIPAGVVEIGAGKRNRQFKQGRGYVTTFPKETNVRLADPTSFNQIRTFTGLQPASSGYPCPKCGLVLKSKSGRTLHLKTCK